MSAEVEALNRAAARVKKTGTGPPELTVVDGGKDPSKTGEGGQG